MTPLSTNPVHAENLTKRYGTFIAVNNIAFDVSAGECVGFLGPNGAGKTTTVKMVSCFSPVTSGSITVYGLDVREHPRPIKSMIGICPQEDSLDPDLTVRKNLSVYARYFNLRGKDIQTRIDQLLELMELTEKSIAPIAELSGGMKRRLMLARALLNQPRLLILDEPTTGLDPQARHLIWDRVRDLKQSGTSVLLTTHYMDEASTLCDRVIMMDHGVILLEGSPADLITESVGNEVVEIWNIIPEVRAYLETEGWTREEIRGRIYIYDERGRIVHDAISRRFPDQNRLIRHATLEDVFLKYAGRTLLE